jgi:hypothetical protein
MSGELYCNGQVVENVQEFKYLGLIIRNDAKCPSRMLESRIEKCQVAFNSIRCR